MARVLIIALVTLGAASTATSEEVPLKRVWSSSMPGTQLSAYLDPEVMNELDKLPKGKHVPAVAQVLTQKLQDKSLVYRFLHSLDNLPSDATTLKGFAVSGTAAEALRNVVRTPIDAVSENLPAGDVTLVFFAHNSPESVQIEKVLRSDRKIEIHYVLVARNVFVDSNQFALIPLGQLSPGEYDVEIGSTQEQRPAARQVCKSFSFNVEER